MSARSLGLASPANAMALPGAKPDGDLSHLSRLPSVHLTVALVYRAFEYAYPSEDAMFWPGRPPSAGPTEWAYKGTPRSTTYKLTINVLKSLGLFTKDKEAVCGVESVLSLYTTTVESIDARLVTLIVIIAPVSSADCFIQSRKMQYWYWDLRIASGRHCINSWMSFRQLRQSLRPSSSWVAWFYYF